MNIEVKNLESAESEPVEILIKGVIGGSFWDDSGTTEKQFCEALNPIPKNRNIIVGINSEGGSVKDGFGMYNALRQRAGKVTTRNDGYALSIASVLMLAGDERVSPKASIWMIHDPWAMACGNKEDMLKAAEMLEKHGETIADIYSERTGMDRDKARALMQAETWFKGEEAVSMKFATTQTDTAVTLNSFDPKRFRNIPVDVLKAISNTAASGDQTTLQAQANQPAVAAEISPATKEVVGGKTEPESESTKGQKMDTNTPAEAAPQNAAADSTMETRLQEIEQHVRALTAQPAPQPRIENKGNPILEAYARMEPGKARANFRVANYEQLVKAREQFLPQAGNTLEAALVTDFLSDGLLTVTPNKLAALAAFSRNFGTDRLKPRSSVWVPYATVGATAQTNASNFESGDTTLSGKEVDVNGISQSFHITHAQANQGYALQQLAEINADTFANAIMDVVTPYLVNAQFGAATPIGVAANFDATALPAIWALAKNYRRRNLILDGGHLAYLLPVNRESFAFGESGAYGFDGIWMNNRWTSAEPNCAGFVCSPDAIAIASGLPKELPAGEFMSIGTVAVKDLGITAQTTTWFSRGGRNWWACYDIMFGANEGDTTAGKILVTS